MALILADRVKESTTTTGTSDFALGGAITGFQTFASAIGANNTTYYAIADGADFEIGLGTLSSDGLTLARTTIYQSSNADAKVVFASGTKQLFVTYVADKAVFEDASGNVSLPANLTVAGGSTTDSVQLDLSAGVTPAVGQIAWDANQGTASLGLLGGNIISRLGQSLVAYVTNAEAVTITKGQAVYLFSAQGDRATVKLAYNTGDATSAKTLGIVGEDIVANGTGFVVCQGVAYGLNLAAFTAGDTLYLGSTAGAVTATKPYAPNHLVYLGVVEKANAGAGQLYVRVQNGYELDELHNVSAQSPTTGQTIVYNSSTSLWEKNTVSLTAGVNGILPIANGGTGTATPSLVAGTNITITGSFPNQTIDAAGSSLTVKDEGSTLTSAATSIDFTGAGVTATNTGGAVTVAITGSGSGISSADIQEFTTTGTSTWTKPAGAKIVYVLMFGGGAGGGSGRRRATASVATAASGGGGGGGSGRTELWIPAVSLGSTETVTVGAGGTGGDARTTDDTNGAAGVDGDDTTFGSWATARGGQDGFGGSTINGTGGAGGGGLGELVTSSTNYSAIGGQGNPSTGSSGNRGGYRPGAGAGAGGFAAGSIAATTGGNGGKGGALFTSSTSPIAGGGGAGAANTNGSNGPNSTTYFVGGDGGGGGGSGLTSPGSGGNGGYPGGGGGGGGAGHGVNSGAGGNGGDGYVRVVTFF